MKNHISIIGAGNLTNSILEGIKKSNKYFKIQVIDINKKKRNISKKYNVIFKSSYTEDISNSEIIMISSKPKDYTKVIHSINPYISDKSIIISFMAGISNKQIKDMLTCESNVVRCMTNLTISQQKSFIFYFMKPTSIDVTNKIKRVLSSFSTLKRCKSENEIDMLTALYGSGPAYYVLFNDIIRSIFIKRGFTKKDSVRYTNDLMLGSANMISENPNTLSILEAISSKGGTTEAALKELKKKNLQKIVSEAINRAYKKSQKILDK